MDEGIINLLLVADNPECTAKIETILIEEPMVSFQITHVKSLQEAMYCLDKDGFDAVLLDLSLPDSKGYDTFMAISDRLPNLPIVMITTLDDQATAMRAFREGAQDYLFMDDLDPERLIKSLVYAAECKRVMNTIEEKLLRDDLTGLYNRRGLLHLGEQQLKLAQRTRRHLLLVFADVDGLKTINETCGRREGDQALIDVAGLFRISFRDSDIVARIGGDEFAILAVNVTQDSDQILDMRLRKNLDAINDYEDQGYILSITWGMVYYDPESPISLEELLIQAEAVMYSKKS